MDIQSEEVSFYKLITIRYKYNLDCYNAFSHEISDHFLMEGLLHYIAPFEPSWSYAYWSSEPLLEYMSHQTPYLAFCELW